MRSVNLTFVRTCKKIILELLLPFTAALFAAQTMELDHKQELKTAAWKVRVTLYGSWTFGMIGYSSGGSERRDIRWLDIGPGRRQVLIL
jgi:hypothetical protein